MRFREWEWQMDKHRDEVLRAIAKLCQIAARQQERRRRRGFFVWR
jgi:hypothetical protein